MKHKIYFLLTLTLLSSCMKVKKKTDEVVPPQPVVTETQESQEPEQQQPRQKAQIKEFFYEYSPEVEGRLQQVKFYFPNHWPDEIIVKKNAAAASAIQLDDSRTWSDAFIGKEKINYKFYRASGDQLELIEDVEVLPALDLDLAEDFNLAKEYKLTTKTKLIYFKNLNLAANKHLYLEDYSGRLQINNLKSAGFIQTFPENARAAEGEKGRSGGALWIDIASAEGQLTIAMLGESGGHGQNGRDPDDSKKGKNGAPGKDARYQDIPGSAPQGSLSFRQICLANGTDGEAGSDGLQGYPGSSGQNGGSSGYAIVRAAIKSIQISSVTLGGQKGLRGLGGRGGARGLGGAAGDNGNAALVDIFCKPLKAGANGNEGPIGDPGKEDGRDGIAGKNQLFLNGEKSSFVNEN